MRLTEWRASAPAKDAFGPKVAAVVEPVLAALGAEADPHCWVAWGDDPTMRYSMLVPIPPGLIVAHVRVNVPGEGPRASGKLVRWSRVQLGELGMETQGGHRLISFQAEGLLLRGADADADRIGAFALALFAAIDGRPMPDLEATGTRGKAATASRDIGTKRGTGSGGAAATGSRRRSAADASAPLALPAPRPSASE